MRTVPRVRRVLVRTWNAFHGNSVPPGRESFLAEGIRMVAEDGPDVVCLQELPVWSLGHLDDWSGMTAVGAVARRPSLGPLPVSAEIGRLVTGWHPGLFRSAFAGQANAILVAPSLRVLARDEIVLNPAEFRRRLAGLNLVERLAWARERRVCHAVRLEDADGGTVLVANLHATRYRRLAEPELVRAAAFADGLAGIEEPIVLAGDFNVVAVRLEDWGFSGGGHRVDHVLARGLSVADVAAWPRERRRRGGVLLSDHAPVDATVS
jgi:endonuclease/exonuclease/phosphatase family metal-dependent hydrolase